MQDLAVKEFKVMHDKNDKQKRGNCARHAGGRFCRYADYNAGYEGAGSNAKYERRFEVMRLWGSFGITYVDVK
jgi:hypothetical protein